MSHIDEMGAYTADEDFFAVGNELEERYGSSSSGPDCEGHEVDHTHENSGERQTRSCQDDCCEYLSLCEIVAAKDTKPDEHD
jgi:hypothetical protein